MNLTISQLRNIIKETVETTFNDKVKELLLKPEFQTVKDFILSKQNKEDFDYYLYDLEALARNNLKVRMAAYLNSENALNSEKDKIVRELRPLGFKLKSNIN
jgi:hypothetical protein